MSTETTNKKIKIDNGTTFGRTYTDKAVDELLKNEGGISVIELTGESGTIASAQLGEINANPQNFAFKYNGKILPFTKVDSTTHQYCNNTTSSSDNNVMTTSTLLTITSSTGVYTIAENVHNVVANSIHPANGGDLTNIQVGSKVYSIPSGGGDFANKLFQHSIIIKCQTSGRSLDIHFTMLAPTANEFTTLKAIHDYMIEVHGEHFQLPAYVRDTDNNYFGVHISPNYKDRIVLRISLLYKRETNEFVDEAIYTVEKSAIRTITDKVFKLI